MRPGSLVVITVCTALLWGSACVSSDVSRELGARCEAKDDCGERCLAAGSSFPDGFCTLSCASDDDCPSRSLCIDQEGGVCLFGCRVEEGCDFLGEGWSCQLELSQADRVEVMVCIGS